MRLAQPIEDLFNFFSMLINIRMKSWALFVGSGRRQVFAILFSQAVFDYISDEANPPLPPDVQDTDARVTGGHNGMSVFALRVQGCDHG